MGVTRIKNNSNALRNRLQRTHARVTALYGFELDKTMTEPRLWASGFGTTHRRNGEIVVGPYRNIWDLGNAARSKQIDIRAFISTFLWDGNGETPVPLVHEGFTTTAGTRVPPRPFTEIAAQVLNLPLRFVEEFNAGG